MRKWFRALGVPAPDSDSDKDDDDDDTRSLREWRRALGISVSLTSPALSPARAQARCSSCLSFSFRSSLSFAPHPRTPRLGGAVVCFRNTVPRKQTLALFHEDVRTRTPPCSPSLLEYASSAIAAGSFRMYVIIICPLSRYAALPARSAVGLR